MCLSTSSLLTFSYKALESESHPRLTAYVCFRSAAAVRSCDNVAPLYIQCFITASREVVDVFTSAPYGQMDSLTGAIIRCIELIAATSDDDNGISRNRSLVLSTSFGVAREMSEEGHFSFKKAHLIEFGARISYGGSDSFRVSVVARECCRREITNALARFRFREFDFD